MKGQYHTTKSGWEEAGANNKKPAEKAGGNQADRIRLVPIHGSEPVKKASGKRKKDSESI